MQFELHTAVWGDWHLSTFEKISLPSLLAPENIPALAQRYKVTYRIFTTPDGQRQIMAMPIYAVLRKYISVELVIMAKDNQTATLDHMLIWHRAYREAALNEVMLIMVPPDHIWPNGLFINAARRLESPEISAIAVPYILMVSETTVPEMRELFLDGADGQLSIKAHELMQMAMRHMHPHSASLIYGAPHSRPALEVMWPVPKKGLLYRCYVRELFMVDTRRVGLTEHFYGTGMKNSKEIYLGTDSNEMVMGALHELTKYDSVHYPDRKLTPIDVAACSMVASNHAPFAWEMAQQPVYFRLKENDVERWWHQERQSLLFFWKVIVNREFLYIREAARENEALNISLIISMMVQATDIVDDWHHKAPFTILVPIDSAIHGDVKQQFIDLASPGNEERLISAVKNHIISGNATPTTQGESSTLETLGGQSLIISSVEEGLLINGRALVTHTMRVGDFENSLCFVDAPIFEHGLEVN